MLGTRELVLVMAYINKGSEKVEAAWEPWRRCGPLASLAGLSVLAALCVFARIIPGALAGLNEVRTYWNLKNLTIKTAGRYIQVSLLGGRSTVGQQTLTLLIGVRIPASQPSQIQQLTKASHFSLSLFYVTLCDFRRRPDCHLL